MLEFMRTHKKVIILVIAIATVFWMVGLSLIPLLFR